MICSFLFDLSLLSKRLLHCTLQISSSKGTKGCERNTNKTQTTQETKLGLGLLESIVCSVSKKRKSHHFFCSSNNK